MERAIAQGSQVLIPPDTGKRKTPRPGWTGGYYAFMRAVLASERGGELYRRRQPMIEPVFGQTKHNRGMRRFHRRGRGRRPDRMAAHHGHPQPPEASPTRSRSRLTDSSGAHQQREQTTLFRADRGHRPGRTYATASRGRNSATAPTLRKRLEGECWTAPYGMTNIHREMSDISPSGLGPVLSALGEQLASVGTDVHLVVIGGSGLLAMGLGDRPTQDVDVVAFVEDGKLVSAAPFPEALDEAAWRVANDFGLKRSWLNDGPTSLLDFGLPDGFEDRMTTAEYGPALRVSFASRLDQIHFKLYAFADRREPRDESDLRRLGPTGDELTAAARWARMHNAPGPFDDAVGNALRAFGVTDVGRDV